MSVVKGEGQFIGSGMSALFLYETLESAADRGYGVIIQPVGPEQSRGFNLYQVTPSKALAYNAMYEALKGILLVAQPADSNSTMVFEKEYHGGFIVLGNRLEDAVKALNKVAGIKDK